MTEAVTEPAVIDTFRGPHRFLSNFYLAPITYDGDVYPSVEHAYQAAKTDDLEWRRTIAITPAPGDAKALGRLVPIAPDWDGRRVPVMRQLVHAKFQVHSVLRGWLLATGHAKLVEGNTFNDHFWGVCRGRGENHLGRILMEVRAHHRSLLERSL